MPTPVMIILLMGLLAILSLCTGWKLARDIYKKKLPDEVDEKAFEEAKAEYLKFFHKRFTPNAEGLAEAFNNGILRENRELKQQRDQLQKELEEERKKNESISSN